MIIQEDSENLSEILFKPQKSYQETSLISNSGIEISNDDLENHISGYYKSWYRPINRFYWVWQGANLLDIDETLAKIACSKNKRSREHLHDTVDTYGPGNWIYEFCYIGQKRALLGKQFLDQGENLKASHEFRMASRYFAIGSFPNLNGDSLAQAAYMLCKKSYASIFENDQSLGNFKEISFTVRDKQVQGVLHYNKDDKLCPCVIICGTYEQTNRDFIRVYTDYFKEHNIAMLVIDLPGIGGSSNIILDANCSEILEKAYEYINENIPFIDTTNIALIGHRLGALAALRAELLHKGNFKLLILIDPAIHSLFVDKDKLIRFPLCQRSSLANRMNLDASNWDTIIPQLKALSLKTQGLLSTLNKSSTKIVCVYVENVLGSDMNDIKLIKSCFKDTQIIKHHSIKIENHKFIAFNQIANIIYENLLK